MYSELHCKSNFSFLEGASHADELFARAAALGYHAVAITDRHTLAGIVRAHGAAKEQGVKLLVGAELHPEDGSPLVVWAPDRLAYAQLCRLLTTGLRRAEKGQCRITREDLATYGSGLLAGVLPPASSPADSPAISQVTSLDEDARQLAAYRELFGDRVYGLVELFRGPDDARRLESRQQAGRRANVPLVAAGDVHYHVAARYPLADILTAIRLGTTVSTAGSALFPNAQRHLRTVDDIRTAFAAAPDLVGRAREVADRCAFSLDELRYEYPEELAPAGRTPLEYLAEQTWDGARRRYPQGVPAAVRKLIEHELQLIGELRYEAYFLTVWDLVRFARSRGILCQGRGSAANSAVCFCLGVTSVDPARTDVLFERFVSRERNEAPDIDVDFEHERREEVLQYLYDKYGRERAGMTAVVITYCARSAIRDVGKALGLPPSQVDAVAKQVEGYRREEKLSQRCEEAGLDPNSPTGRRLVHFVNELIGFPRHLSQHVGGMVMTRGPLCELAPIENAAMPGRTVIQWDKNDLDELGILKVDCLCLGMLTAIRKCFALIERHHGRQLTLATIPAEDSQVYDMVCRADTMGVFQIESRAQMSMLPRLQPRCFYDLVIEVAIVRPGPIQGQMVHPYLRRRRGEEQPVYPSDEIREVLHKTLGVPLFQEQAMRLAVVAAGFTPGEADQLRRAMGAWRRPGVIDQFRIKLLEGMKSRGLSEMFAQQVFQQIRGFGEYGFPESHAASFALLVYVSAWLKRYYPAAFVASLLNSQPMGFYAPAQLVRDARQHGVLARPVDVNHSQWDCTLEPLAASQPLTASQPLAASRSREPQATPEASDSHESISANARGDVALRLGFRLIGGLPRTVVETLVAARRDGPYLSVDDLSRRTKLSPTMISRLAEADAFQSLRMDRRAALWQALGQESRPADRPLWKDVADDEPLAELPPLPLMEQVLADYQTSGLSLKAHPIAFFRRQLDRLRVTPAGRLDQAIPNRQLRVAGLVLLRQRPSTARGITFVTLEDETGVANLVIRAGVWEQYYSIARRSPVWIAHGKLERQDAVMHILVNRLEDLSATLGNVAVSSRDFR